MGCFTWTLANKRTRYTKFGDPTRSSVLKYGDCGYLMCPDGSYIKEPAYDGYGIFDGKDVYDLVVDWNREDLKVLFETRVKDGFGANLKDVAEYFMTHSDAETEIFVAKKIKEEKLPYYLIDEWKRNIGIAIACNDEDNAALMFPIKVVSSTRLRYDKLPPSCSCQ